MFGWVRWWGQPAYAAVGVICMECSCFHCLTIFAAAEVVDWIDDGNTPLCPYCGSDALVDGVTDLMELWRLHERRFGNTSFTPWDAGGSGRE